MQPWVANLIGLTLGFAVSGEALYIAFFSLDDAVEPPAATATAPPVPPARRVATNTPTLPMVRPVELPRITPAPLPRPDALPAIIHPDPPPTSEQEAHKPGSGVAGTGFFVASDGSLLTAAHVVSGCRQTRIVSQLVKPATAQMVAIDTGQDIALLRASHATPPAVLPIGRPAGTGGRLFVLGYPASGSALVPTETWAVLENAQFPPAPAELTDPRRLIWAVAPAISHGFSGGPILDPRNGAVVGIVRGLVDSTRIHAVRAAVPAAGMVIGPGSSPLTALLRREGADGDPLQVSGEDSLDAARRATVRVLCLY